MKGFIIFLSFSIMALTASAQHPKGDRILAWQVDMTQNVNYDSAYVYAEMACMESLHLTIPWSSVEPNNGMVDANFIHNVLDVANIYYPAKGMKIELQIPTINTSVKQTPMDLLTTDFDDPIMINRFKIFLDTLFTHIPNIKLSALNIGNEYDIYMGQDAVQYSKYKAFLDAVIPHAKQLYFNNHEKLLDVGTTFSYKGISALSTSALCQMVNESLDIVSVTYYPINDDFTMKSPDVVYDDFNTLASLYSDSSQPIYIVECGYASSDQCNSSEALQAEFFKNVFTAWDDYEDNIKYLNIFKSTDWSQQKVDDLASFYGIQDIKFKEYLRTLGVRTWENNGTNKIAYETILCELAAREWCAVNCIISASNEFSEDISIMVYPNPTNDFLIIDIAQDIHQVEIYNDMGTLVFSSSDKIIQLNQIPDGIYYIIVEDITGRIQGESFIKQ